MIKKMVSRRLRFIIEGEGDADAAAATAAASAAATAAAATAAAAKPVAPAAATAQAGPATGKTFSEDYVKELREEAASRRVEAKKNADEREAALKELETVKSEVTTLKTASALSSAIATAGGNTVAAAAIRGDNILAELDPAAADYTTKVQTAVTKYITDHPELRAAPGAARSSVSYTGGTGEGATRPKSIQEAVERANRT